MKYIIIIYTFIFISCVDSETKSKTEKQNLKLPEMRVVETYDSGKPKEIEYIIGDTTLVHSIKENGIITHKMTFINEWLFEKILSAESGKIFLYEKFDNLKKDNNVRYRIEFSKYGDTLAYGLMKNEATYFGKWTDLSKPNFKVISIIGKNGELPDSSTVYYNNKVYRKIGTNQIDDPIMYELK
jgi:hypothetical protein